LIFVHFGFMPFLSTSISHVDCAASNFGIQMHTTNCNNANTTNILSSDYCTIWNKTMANRPQFLVHQWLRDMQTIGQLLQL